MQQLVSHSGIQSNPLLLIKVFEQMKTIIEVEKNEKIEAKGSHEKVDIRTKVLIKDEKILVEIFNKPYINIVKKTSGIAPKNP